MQNMRMSGSKSGWETHIVGLMIGAQSKLRPALLTTFFINYSNYLPKIGENTLTASGKYVVING